ncbi:hypothetical protein NL108_001589 [Boleophthalmus pectinirostris]|nr:hypothetical protein NL108_001589 [Boleophthalmus pectinirostris]
MSSFKYEDKKMLLWCRVARSVQYGRLPVNILFCPYSHGASVYQIWFGYAKVFVGHPIDASRISDFRSLCNPYWEGFSKKVSVKLPCLFSQWDVFIVKVDLFKSFEPYHFCFWF